jgi:anti-sigma B factor antagonist
MQTAPDLETALSAAVVPPRPKCLIVDLDEVDFIGTRGLRLLVDFSARCREAVVDFRIAGAARPVRRALEVTGLDRTLNVYASFQLSKAT